MSSFQKVRGPIFTSYSKIKFAVSGQINLNRFNEIRHHFLVVLNDGLKTEVRESMKYRADAV